MKVYLVGGSVRDELLGINNENTERDFVVVGSSTTKMLKLGYKQVGKDFPVFLHPKTKEEYALARIEKKISKGYKGFEFETSKITLIEDLSRRDLTINAIAKDKNNNLIDPFNGQEDLKNKTLRHISPSFSEDPVRVLRVARFAAKFDFHVAIETQKLMQKMALSGEVDALVPERVFQELNKALSTKKPSKFFTTLQKCNAYEKIFAPLRFTKIQCWNKTTPEIGFAVWLSTENEENIKKLCLRIKCPKKYQQLAILSSNWLEFTKSFAAHNTEQIYEFFAKTDALRQKNRFDNLLEVFKIMNININPIIKLRNKLSAIDTTKFDKRNISKEIKIEKLAIIDLFFHSTK